MLKLMQEGCEDARLAPDLSRVPGTMHYGDPVLGLPDAIRACLFDLDGVLTPTALIHAAAWKEMFDAFLGEYQGAGYTPFDKVKDYDKYVDGRPRDDGTRTFLASRGITLPEGSPDGTLLRATGPGKMQPRGER